MWATVLGIAALIGLALFLRAVPLGDNAQLFIDSDDAMHMVTAQSLAHGQAWFDTTSYRENAPFGAPIHFSRLIDAPLAGLMLLLGQFFGAGADDLTALLYPVLLIPLLAAAAFALIRQVVPGASAVVSAVVPFLSAVILVEFSPGRVDHHNVQMILTTVMVACTIAGRRDLRAAMLAGVFAALSLAVGAETFHLVAVAIAVFGIYWVLEPANGRQVAGFAVGLAAAGAALFFGLIAPAAYLTRACDAFSFSYVVALVAAAVALFGTVTIGGRIGSPVLRFALLAVAGALAVALTVVISPECLRGPYAAVPPALLQDFLGTVPDAWSAARNFALRPAETFIVLGIPVLELAIGVALAWRVRGEARINWIVLLVFLAVALALSFVQLRGARLAVIYGVPVAVAVIEGARQRYLRGGGVAALLLTAVAFVPFAGLVQLPIAEAIDFGRKTPAAPVAEGTPRPNAPGGDWSRCATRAGFAKLAALPKGNVIAPIGIAPTLLYFTAHNVVGTGYHRDVSGMADNVAFFSGSDAVAERIARERGLNYVALCGAFEMTPEGGPAPDAIAAGIFPPWLVPISDPGDGLQLYRVALATP
jgi:hypothetical protein